MVSKNEKTILRTGKVMLRAMCGVKLIEKRSQELMSLLGLKDTLDGLTRMSGAQWYGHVLRDMFMFEKRKILKWRGRLNMTENMTTKYDVN